MSLMTVAAMSVDRLLALLLRLRYKQIVLKRTYFIAEADNPKSTLLFIELILSSVKLILVVSKLVVIGYRLSDKLFKKKK